jgi:hypothetical protein
MELTTSHRLALPVDIQQRYELREVRNAARILEATNPVEFSEIVQVLQGFSLTTEDITEAGGNKSKVAARIDHEFRELGWREGRHDTTIKSVLRVMPYAPNGEKSVEIREYEVYNEGYKVDNVKGRVALDVEWNAKDGNLDRDLSAYRALYEAGIIDAAALITRTQEDIRKLATDLGVKRFDTTTTTNLNKLEPRLTRGDSGGCPLLVVAISRRCYNDPGQLFAP